MLKLEALLYAAGILHFAVLIASALVPSVLDWRTELARLGLMTRQLVWVHGIFIVLVIIGFGALTLINVEGLAAGSVLARSVCGFIALFWTSRLAVQFFVFDPREHVKHWLLRIGNHGLTVVFAFFSIVYGWAALWPEHSGLRMWSAAP